MSPDAADLALEAVSARAVVALIARLPRDQAEIIMPRVVADLKTAEVARIVGKSRGRCGWPRTAACPRLADLAERAGVTR